MTAVEYLVDHFKVYVTMSLHNEEIEKAKEMERQQQGKMYSEGEVFDIIYKLFDGYASNYTNKAVNYFDENLKKTTL